MRRNAASLASLLFFTAGWGCAVAGKVRVPAIGGRNYARFSIQINVVDGANRDSPIPVDFVMVADKKLMPEVAKMSARDWYDRRAQIQRDFPTKVQILSWEWVPGDHVGPISVEIEAKTLAGFLFANYSNGGEHRAYVDVRKPIVMNLGAEEFVVQSLR
jgi:type VI secretion system protein